MNVAGVRPGVQSAVKHASIIPQSHAPSGWHVLPWIGSDWQRTPLQISACPFPIIPLQSRVRMRMLKSSVVAHDHASDNPFVRANAEAAEFTNKV
jgi:hypothetical protein